MGALPTAASATLRSVSQPTPRVGREALSVEAKLARATRTEREREPRSAIENERAASLWLLPRAPGASLRNQNAPQYAERRQMIKLSTQ